MCRTPRRVQRGPRTPRLSGAGSSVSLEGEPPHVHPPAGRPPGLRRSPPHRAWPRAAAKAAAAAARTCATSCRIRTGAWRRAAGQAPRPRPAGRLDGPRCTTIQLNCTTVQLNCTTPTPPGRGWPTGRPATAVGARAIVPFKLARAPKAVAGRQVCRPLPWERGTS